MDTDNKDQVLEDVVEDQPSTEQSEDTNEESKDEPITLERVSELTQALQKGYTLTRQDLAEIKENLQTIATSKNQESGAQSGDDEYLTVGKLKTILSEQANTQVQQQEQKNKEVEGYIDSTLVQLRADGILKGKEDEDEFMKYAVSKKETDLFKAADRWQEVRQAREEGRKESTKAKVRQDEGSKVGTSSKSTGEEQEGIDYRAMQAWKREQGF